MNAKLDDKSELKAKRLRDKVARFNSGFKLQYPLLADFVDGTRPLEDCSTSFYRKKIRDHLDLMKQLTIEATRLETAGQSGAQGN